MPLTPKQEAFAQLVASGTNHSDAYRAAYDCKESGLATINVNSCKLAAQANVSLRIAELQDIQAAEALATKGLVLHRALRNCDSAYENKEYAASNGALAIIVGVQGLKVTKVEHSGSVELRVLPGLSEEELLSLQKRAVDDAKRLGVGVVEGEFREVTESDG